MSQRKLDLFEWGLPDMRQFGERPAQIVWSNDHSHAIGVSFYDREHGLRREPARSNAAVSGEASEEGPIAEARRLLPTTGSEVGPGRKRHSPNTSVFSDEIRN